MTLATWGLEGLTAAFVGGVLTSASPCVLAAVPVAVGFVGGQAKPADSPARAWSLSLAFVAGMNLALMVLGLMAARLGGLLGALPGPWMAGVGLGVVAPAAWLAFGAGASCSLALPAAWRQRFARGGATGAVVLGALIGTVMSPCATPALAAALAVAGTGTLGDGAPWWGAALLLAYGLGHSVLLLAAGAAPALATTLIRRVGAWQPWLPGRRLFAAVLAAAGLWWTALGLGMVTA